MSRYVLTDGHDCYNYMFSGIENVSEFPYRSFKKQRKSIGWILYRITHSKKFGTPLLNIWYQYVIRKWRIKSDDTVLILNNAIFSAYYELGILLMLKKKGCRIVLLLVDSFEVIQSEQWDTLLLEVEAVSDAIYTFSLKDSLKYGWKHTYQYYAKVKCMEVHGVKSDVFCVMSNNDRIKQIVEIYDILEKKGIGCLFYISGVCEDEQKKYNRKGIVFNRYLAYGEVLSYISQAKVILEVVKEKQNACSLRAFESVVYNKRLLTNSPAITEFPYFNAKYMKTYSDVSDINYIDSSFFISDEIVDYHYQGDFSPIKLFEEIEASDL